MFELALMVALVYTKLMCTVQSTVSELVVRPYVFSTRDQNSTLDQKGTGMAYHYDTLRTTRCAGTNVRRTRTVRHRTRVVRWIRNTMVRRTVMIRFVPSNVSRRLTRKHSVPFRYESYCFGTACRTITVRRTGHGTAVPLIFY